MLRIAFVNKNFGPWFEKRFLAWQLEQGGRKSIEQFSKHLGYAKTTVVQWLNGQRVPGPDNAFQLAVKLGLDVYDALDLPRPNPVLFAVQANWGLFTEVEQERIARIVEEAKKRDAKAEKNKHA